MIEGLFTAFVMNTRAFDVSFTVQIRSQLFEIYFLPLQWLILWIILRAIAEHFDHQPDTYKNVNEMSHLELQKLRALSCGLR